MSLNTLCNSSLKPPCSNVLQLTPHTIFLVYIDHNVDIVSANAIASALNGQGFGAIVKKDASVALDQMAGIPTDLFVSSSFDMTHVLEDTNKADKGNIAEVIQACLQQKFSEAQVKNVTVIKLEKALIVEHNPYYLTASSIVDTLANHFFDVSITSDGAADGMWVLALMKEDSQDIIERESSSVRWTVVLSGVLWVISMVSLNNNVQLSLL